MLAGCGPADPDEPLVTDAGSFSCDIDGISGTFLVVYDKLDGDCGDLPPSTYEIPRGAWWQAPGCTPSATSTSTDQCSSTGRAHCVLEGATTEISGTITQESDEVIQGMVHMAITTDMGTCTSDYRVRYMRLP